jgi:hypothetical protein
MKCLILVDTEDKVAHAGTDMSFMAELLHVTSDTIKRRLPYWKDGRYILSVAEYVKSDRGIKSVKK